MTLSYIMVTVLFDHDLTDCSIRVCFVSIFERGIKRDTGGHKALYKLRTMHVQMQNNAMFRIICLRIGHALLKFRFTASGLVFRGGQCVLIKTLN